MKKYTCKPAITKDEVLQAIFLRRKVLVREFGYSTYANEPDRFDLLGTIYVVKDGNKVVGTVRVREDDNVHRVQRVAIHEDYRKKGVGTVMLQKVLKQFSKVYVMAPRETVDFYERFGFKKTGDIQKGKVHKYFRMQNY